MSSLRNYIKEVVHVGGSVKGVQFPRLIKGIWYGASSKPAVYWASVAFDVSLD